MGKIFFNKDVMRKGYATFVFLLIGGWIHLVGLRVDGVGHVSISNTAIVVQLLVYLLGGIGVACNLSDSVKLLRVSKVGGALIVFCCASVFWSQDSYFTATRLVGLAGGVTIALLVVVSFTVSEFLLWMVGAFVAVSVTNYLFIYICPEIAIRTSQVWKGIFVNENQLGLTIILFLILGCFLIDYQKKYTIMLYALALLLVMPLVYFSYSMMGYVAYVISIVIMVLLSLYYKYKFSLNWVWIFSFLLSLVGIFFWSDLVILLGKKSSIGGRIVIWDLVYDQVKASPWLGHGYGSLVEADIFRVPFHLNDLKSVVEKMAPYYGTKNIINPDIDRIAARYALHMKNGVHNGFLDILFWLGWIGSSLFVIFIVNHFRKIYVLLKYGYNKTSVMFFTVYTAIFLVINTGESQMLVRSGLVWVIFVFVVFKVNESYDLFSQEVLSVKEKM